MTTLTRPVFETGPKDPVDIVDVYTTVDPEVRNNLTSKLSSFGSSLSDVFGAGVRSIGNLDADIQSGKVEQLTYDLAPQLENFPKKERTLLTLNIRTTLFELLAKLVSSEYVVSRRVAYLQQCHSKVRT